MASRHYRAHQRFLADVPITVTSIHRSVGTRGHTLDLGVGGAACELDAPLRLGEKVQVVLTLDRPHIVNGEVAWVGWAESSSVRLGVRFNLDDAEELASILDQLDLPDSTANVGT